MDDQRGPIPPLADDLTARYEIGDDESPSQALVAVISSLTGLEATEMRPIQAYVDLDAVDAFLDSTAGEASWAGSLLFELDDCALFVNPEAVVVIADPPSNLPSG